MTGRNECSAKIEAPDGGDSAASKMVSSAVQMTSGNFQEAFLTSSVLRRTLFLFRESRWLSCLVEMPRSERGVKGQQEDDVMMFQGEKGCF